MYSRVRGWSGRLLTQIHGRPKTHNEVCESWGEESRQRYSPGVVPRRARMEHLSVPRGTEKKRKSTARLEKEDRWEEEDRKEAEDTFDDKQASELLSVW